MAWVYLIIASVLEIIWASALKESQGLTKLYPSLIAFIFSLFSFYMLALAVKSLPVGTSYAVWTGIGAVGVAIVGIIYYGEPATPLRLACIALIVLGIIGLKLSTSQP